MTGRILVVDNDAEMLSLLRRHLESDGHTVSTAASGRVRWPPSSATRSTWSSPTW